MKHRDIQSRWTMFVLLVCFLVCVFAFQAKLVQYQTIHDPLSNVYSNKMWFSIEDRSSIVSLLAALPLLTLALGCAVLVFTFAGRVPLRVGITYLEEKTTHAIPIGVQGPSLFRRPPPIA